MLRRLTSAVRILLEGVFLMACSLAALFIALLPGLSRFNDAFIVWWARGALWLAGVHWSVEGLEHFPATGPCVVVSNHLSALDIPLLMAAVPGTPRFMAKHTIFKVPIFGWLLRVEGFVPVDRTRQPRARASLEPATEVLRRGRRILVFPEGTRSRTGRTGVFKTGAFRMAITTGVPVVPVTLIGTDRVFPPKSRILYRGEVRLVAGPPIPTDGMVWEERNRLRDRVRSWIIDQRGEEPVSSPDDPAGPGDNGGD